MRLRIFWTWKCYQKFKWRQRQNMIHTWGDQTSWFAQVWAGSQAAGFSVLQIETYWLPYARSESPQGPWVCAVCGGMLALGFSLPPSQPWSFCLQTPNKSLITPVSEWQHGSENSHQGQENWVQVSAPTVTGKCFWQDITCSGFPNERELYLLPGLSWSLSEVVHVEMLIQLSNSR